MRFLAGVLISELFALWVEFFYKFGFKLNPAGFLISIPFYFVLLLGLHALFQRFSRLWPMLLVAGAVGLAVEWFVVGNSPWQNPKASQLIMFLYHSVYPTLGFLLVRRRLPRRLLGVLAAYFTAATAVCAVGFLLPAGPLRLLWFIYSPALGYLGLLPFLRRIHRLPARPSGHPAESDFRRQYIGSRKEDR